MPEPYDAVCRKSRRGACGVRVCLRRWISRTDAAPSTADDTEHVWMTLLFGAVASSALIIGAGIGVRFELPKRLLAMLLAFAAGALITALTFELFEDSYERGGIWRAGIGLFVGALVFTALSALLD